MFVLGLLLLALAGTESRVFYVNGITMKTSKLRYLAEESEERPVKRATGQRPTAHSVSAIASNGVPNPESAQIDIAEVLRTIGMHYVHVLSLPAVDCFDPEAGDVPISGTVEGKISLTNTGALLVLRGKAHATVWLPCSRCLEKYEEPLVVVLEEEYDLVADFTATRQEDVVAVDQNVTAPVVSGTILDVAELLRQSLTLAEPMQPFCGDACEGFATYTTDDDVDSEDLPSEMQRPFAGLAALLQSNTDTD